MALKHEKTAKAIAHAAAEFISGVSNRTSLITVTGVTLSPKRDRATVLITVLPDSQEAAAVEFCNRQAGGLRDFLKKRIALQRLPFLSFAMDRGEKNRQRLEELSS
jgi:ribosome-binding factor A